MRKIETADEYMDTGSHLDAIAAFSKNYRPDLTSRLRGVSVELNEDDVTIRIASGERHYSSWDELKLCKVSPDDAVRLGKAMQEYGQKLIDEQFNTPISKKEFDNLQVGDKIVLVRNLKFGFMATPSRGIPGSEVFVNDIMEDLAAKQTILTVRSKNGTSITAAGGSSFTYTQEMIQKVTYKAPVKHYNVSFNMGEMWYAGSGGKVSNNRENAAKMNRQHAEAVSKKYGGVIVEVK